MFFFCTLVLEEKEQVGLAAQAHADELHWQDSQKPIGMAGVPCVDPDWDNQQHNMGRTRCSHMVTCLIAGLHKAAHKAVNFEKMKDITQWAM